MAELKIIPRVDDGRSMVRLRVTLSQAAEAAGLLALPTAPGTWTGADPQALWLSPDQWLLVSRMRPAEALIADCARSLAGVLHHATNSTDALACLALEGSAARSVLAMGSGVDFDPTRFKAGQCVRTRLTRIAAVIAAVDGERFELYVDRSVGAWLADWLHNAVRDPLVGVAAQP